MEEIFGISRGRFIQLGLDMKGQDFQRSASRGGDFKTGGQVDDTVNLERPKTAEGFSPSQGRVSEVASMESADEEMEGQFADDDRLGLVDECVLGQIVWGGENDVGEFDVADLGMAKKVGRDASEIGERELGESWGSRQSLSRGNTGGS